MGGQWARMLGEARRPTGNQEYTTKMVMGAYLGLRICVHTCKCTCTYMYVLGPGGSMHLPWGSAAAHSLMQVHQRIQTPVKVRPRYQDGAPVAVLSTQGPTMQAHHAVAPSHGVPIVKLAGIVEGMEDGLRALDPLVAGRRRAGGVWVQQGRIHGWGPWRVPGAGQVPI